MKNWHSIYRMNNTSNTNNAKRGRGRPKKDSTIKTSEGNDHTVGIPVLLEPNIHDIHDELSRMDSFTYSKYN